MVVALAEQRRLTDTRYEEIKGWHEATMARMDSFEKNFLEANAAAKAFRRKQELKVQGISDCLKNVAENTKTIRELFEEGSAVVHLFRRVSTMIQFVLKYMVLPVAAIIILFYTFSDDAVPAWYIKLQGWVN